MSNESPWSLKKKENWKEIVKADCYRLYSTCCIQVRTFYEKLFSVCCFRFLHKIFTHADKASSSTDVIDISRMLSVSSSDFVFSLSVCTYCGCEQCIMYKYVQLLFILVAEAHQARWFYSDRTFQGEISWRSSVLEYSVYHIKRHCQTFCLKMPDICGISI